MEKNKKSEIREKASWNSYRAFCCVLKMLVGLGGFESCVNR
jgi:hypothetical protein